MSEGEDFDPAEAVMRAADELIFGENTGLAVEGLFTLAVRVGVMLNQWNELMSEKFSRGWVEETSMVLFNKYFTPYVPPYGDPDD